MFRLPTRAAGCGRHCTEINFDFFFLSFEARREIGGGWSQGGEPRIRVYPGHATFHYREFNVKAYLTSKRRRIRHSFDNENLVVWGRE